MLAMDTSGTQFASESEHGSNAKHAGLFNGHGVGRHRAHPYGNAAGAGCGAYTCMVPRRHGHP